VINFQKHHLYSSISNKQNPLPALTLQSSAIDDTFKFVPMIRTPKDERLDAVQALLKGLREGVRTVPVIPGTLLLFHGRYSIHRVTPIDGKKPRYLAFLGHGTQSSATSSEHLQYMSTRATVERLKARRKRRP
jgi:hypothetical protein